MCANHSSPIKSKPGVPTITKKEPTASFDNKNTITHSVSSIMTASDERIKKNKDIQDRGIKTTNTSNPTDEIRDSKILTDDLLVKLVSALKGPLLGIIGGKKTKKKQRNKAKLTNKLSNIDTTIDTSSNKTKELQSLITLQTNKILDSKVTNTQMRNHIWNLINISKKESEAFADEFYFKTFVKPLILKKINGQDKKESYRKEKYEIGANIAITLLSDLRKVYDSSNKSKAKDIDYIINLTDFPVKRHDDYQSSITNIVIKVSPLKLSKDFKVSDDITISIAELIFDVEEVDKRNNSKKKIKSQVSFTMTFKNKLARYLYYILSGSAGFTLPKYAVKFFNKLKELHQDQRGIFPYDGLHIVDCIDIKISKSSVSEFDESGNIKKSLRGINPFTQKGLAILLSYIVIPLTDDELKFNSTIPVFFNLTRSTNCQAVDNKKKMTMTIHDFGLQEGICNRDTVRLQRLIFNLNKLKLTTDGKLQLPHVHKIDTEINKHTEELKKLVLRLEKKQLSINQFNSLVLTNEMKQNILEQIVNLGSQIREKIINKEEDSEDINWKIDDYNIKINEKVYLKIYKSTGYICPKFIQCEACQITDKKQKPSLCLQIPKLECEIELCILGGKGHSIKLELENFILHTKHPLSHILNNIFKASLPEELMKLKDFVKFAIYVLGDFNEDELEPDSDGKTKHISYKEKKRIKNKKKLDKLNKLSDHATYSFDNIYFTDSSGNRHIVQAILASAQEITDRLKQLSFTSTIKLEDIKELLSSKVGNSGGCRSKVSQVVCFLLTGSIASLKLDKHTLSLQSTNSTISLPTVSDDNGNDRPSTPEAELVKSDSSRFPSHLTCSNNQLERSEEMPLLAHQKPSHIKQQKTLELKPISTTSSETSSDSIEKSSPDNDKNSMPYKNISQIENISNHIKYRMATIDIEFECFTALIFPVLNWFLKLILPENFSLIIRAPIDKTDRILFNKVERIYVKKGTYNCLQRFFLNKYLVYLAKYKNLSVHINHESPDEKSIVATYLN